MAKIFVSYRQEDTSSEAGRITDWLDRHFGQDKVFRDITALKPGADYPRIIKQEIASIDALIAVIGPGWIDAKDKFGNRRLDDPADWVRLEIANALPRGILVIPVLVKGAAMPHEDQLPEDLRQLHTFTALPITERHWHAGIAELIDALDGVVAPQPAPPPPPPPPVLADSAWTVLGVLAGAAMLLSGVFIRGSNDETFLHPRFGGPANFHDSDLLWRLAGVFTTLPTLGIVVTAIVALVVVRRKAATRAAFAGLILLLGLQGAAFYAGVLAVPAWKATGFGIALVGGLLLVAVALPLVARLVRAGSGPPDRSLGLAVRATAVVGAAVMVVGMAVDFNNGGPAPEHRYAGSVLDGNRVEQWDLLLIATAAAAIGLLAPLLRVPRPLLGGALLACGIGAACIWPRFIAIPLMEIEAIASPGAGGFIGLAGAGLILFSGYVALHGAQRQERLAGEPQLS